MSNQFDGVDGTKCPHENVERIAGDDGLWCTRCWLKIFAREKRPCAECRRYIGGDKPCGRMMFGEVFRDDGHALFRIKDRTCFEEKPQFLKKAGLKAAIKALKGVNRAMEKLSADSQSAIDTMNGKE